MTDSGRKIQALMDEVYSEWHKAENMNKGKWDILNGFSEAHKIAVTFGNFNYQVENGGIEQWIYNGYFNDDAEKLTEYLVIGAESDERCKTILDRIYELDQYAQDTDCDRYGNFHGRNDEDGESNFIGDIINCNEFDTWYYVHCGKDDWWDVVSGIIEKVEAHGLAPAEHQEHNESENHIKPPLQVYIGNVHDERIAGFTVPLPTTMEAMRQLMNVAEITGWQDMEILEVMSDINNLGEAINENVKRTMSKDALDELNYLAARIADLGNGNGFDIFAAAVEAKQHTGSIAEIISLTFNENLNRYDVMPTFDEKIYGDFLVNSAEQSEHAEAFNRLKASEDPADKALAAHIEKLEKHIDYEAYGRTAAKEEHGVFTEHGYLTGGEGFQEIYKGPQDIPAEHRLFTEPGEAVKYPMKLDGVDITAIIMELHAVYTGQMELAPIYLKTLIKGTERDYLLLADRDNVYISTVTEAYKRGTEASAFISLAMKSPEERPDFMAFAIRINNREENTVTGDLVELNGKALYANITRHAVSPDRIDAVFSNGASKTYDLWDWADMPSYAREDIRTYEPHYPDSVLKETEKQYASFMGANEIFGEVINVDVFLAKINAAYMAAAENPQPDMIRVANEAAKDILARGEADVYRLTPEGAVKLAAIEAMRPMCFAEHRELAVKREDADCLGKWARHAVNKAIRQDRRDEISKSKQNNEEL